jgi:hypothetical protein
MGLNRESNQIIKQQQQNFLFFTLNHLKHHKVIELYFDQVHQQQDLLMLILLTKINKIRKEKDSENQFTSSIEYLRR